MELRKYQEEARESIQKEWAEVEKRLFSFFQQDAERRLCFQK